MMSRGCLTTALLLACLAGQTAAQDAPGPNLSPERGGATGGPGQMAFASRLFLLGMARKDPLAVLAAARLAGAVELHDLDLEKVTPPKGVPPGAPEHADGPGATASAMLAAARNLAGTDDALLAQVDEAEAAHPEGRVTAARSASTLAAGQQESWTLPFFGATLAEVAVIGDSTAALRLRIADADGNPVCQTGGPDSIAYCAWTPARNGYFTATVDNSGPNPARYDVLAP